MPGGDENALLSWISDLEAKLTQLIRTAPDLDRGELEAAARSALDVGSRALAASGDSGPMAVAALAALAIERVLDDVAAGRLEQGIALPSVAMAACAIQQAATSPTPQIAQGLNAATFELETMLPIPTSLPRPGSAPSVAIHVPLERLSPVVAQAHLAECAAKRARRFASIAHDLDDPLLVRLADARKRYDVSPIGAVVGD